MKNLLFAFFIIAFGKLSGQFTTMSDFDNLYYAVKSSNPSQATARLNSLGFRFFDRKDNIYTYTDYQGGILMFDLPASSPTISYLSINSTWYKIYIRIFMDNLELLELMEPNSVYITGYIFRAQGYIVIAGLSRDNGCVITMR